MPRTATQVLLYYPNLIGYARVLFMVLSFYFAKTNPRQTIIFYLLAFGGDVIDGYVARLFKQSSTYGGILDMVTDRVSTCGFLILLSHLYPEHSFAFVMLVVLDIASHWFHVMSTNEQHHKSKEALETRSSLLQWYYSIYPLFGYCCVGCELFYVLLYVTYHFPNPHLSTLCWYGCLPACVIKNIINVVQLSDAARIIAGRDAATHNRDHAN